MKSLFKILLIAGIFLTTYGCFKITYNMRGASIPPDIETISVQFFTNRAPRVNPNLTQDFTDGLKDFMESNTSLRMVTGYGDVDFSGQITRYDIAPAGIAAGDVASKTRFTIAVKVKYTSTKHPDDDFEETFSRFREFSNEETDFSSVEAELTEEIVDELIEQIFNKAFVNW